MHGWQRPEPGWGSPQLPTPWAAWSLRGASGQALEETRNATRRRAAGVGSGLVRRCLVQVQVWGRGGLWFLGGKGLGMGEAGPGVPALPPMRQQQKRLPELGVERLPWGPPAQVNSGALGQASQAARRCPWPRNGRAAPPLLGRLTCAGAPVLVEDVAGAAGAVKAAQVVVAVVVAGRCLSRGHLAFIDVWGGEGHSTGLRGQGMAPSWPPLPGRSQ